MVAYAFSISQPLFSGQARMIDTAQDCRARKISFEHTHPAICVAVFVSVLQST